MLALVRWCSFTVPWCVKECCGWSDRSGLLWVLRRWKVHGKRTDVDKSTEPYHPHKELLCHIWVSIHQLQYQWVKDTTVFTCMLSHYSSVPSSLGYLTACFLIWHGMLVFMFMYASVVCEGLLPFNTLCSWEVSPLMFSCWDKQEVTCWTPGFFLYWKFTNQRRTFLYKRGSICQHWEQSS